MSTGPALSIIAVAVRLRGQCPTAGFAWVLSSRLQMQALSPAMYMSVTAGSCSYHPVLQLPDVLHARPRVLPQAPALQLAASHMRTRTAEIGDPAPPVSEYFMQ